MPVYCASAAMQLTASKSMILVNWFIQLRIVKLLCPVKRQTTRLRRLIQWDFTSVNVRLPGMPCHAVHWRKAGGVFLQIDSVILYRGCRVWRLAVFFSSGSFRCL